MANDEVTIKFQDGRIKGIRMTNEKGKEYLYFSGIPYAEPPERFKPPVAKKQLAEDKLLDATKEGPVCVQINLPFMEANGQEDCLILNVNSPVDILTNPHKKYPVIIWIHGGGWQLGSGANFLYGPGKFMDKEIVFVSINYRLGSLGFLTTNDDNAPGNYGMLDQVEALKWVKENIDDFGGDPGQVTIMGESAGSASVFYHMLSPLSKGLFHRVIAMSGNPLCTWASGNDFTRWTRRLAKIVNFPGSNNMELIDYLRKLDAAELVNAVRPRSGFTTLSFIPNVDGIFLEDNPAKMLKDGRIYSKVPVLTGVTKDEGATFYPMFNRNLEEFSDEFMEKNVTKFYNAPPNYSKVAKAIKEKYFKDVDIKDKLQVASVIVRLFSDSMAMANLAAVQYLTRYGVETYTYSFDFRGKMSIVDLMGFQHDFGVAHGDDLLQIFDNKVFSEPASDEEISSKMISLWTNFAISGDPNGDLGNRWPHASNDKEIPVCHIDKPIRVETIDPGNNPKFNFWTKVIPDIILSTNLKGKL